MPGYELLKKIQSNKRSKIILAWILYSWTLRGAFVSLRLQELGQE
ncbi:unnamed protein product [Rhodiola kirilowii]